MKGIVGRLWLTIVTIVAVILALLGLFLSQLFNNFYFNLQADNLVAQGENLGQLVLSASGTSSLIKELSLVEDFLNANVIIMDKTGLISSVSPGMKHHRRPRSGADALTPPQVAAVLSGRTVVIKGYRAGLDTTMLTVAVPIRTGNEVMGAVYLYTPLAPITKTIASVRKLIIYGILATMGVATIFAFFLSRRLSQPLIRMEQAAQAMAGGDFSPRIPVNSDDEIARLGLALNHLAAELAETLATLGSERDQLAEILAAMTDGVLTFSSDGELLLHNPPAALYLAPIVDLANGQRLGEDFALGDLEQSVREVVLTGQARGTEFKLHDKTFIARLAPLRQEDVVQAVVCVILDMTEERMLEEMRREFVANVSHELRTPLTYLQGYAEAIIDGLAVDREEEQKYIRIILDETLRLKRLVDDLLDLARIQAGQLDLKKEPVELPSLINAIFEKLEPMAAAQRVNLSTDVDAAALRPVWGNADRLQQIMINLINNALRYTPAQGNIYVAARQKGDDCAEITVCDTGSGMAKEDVPYVFERFFKQEKARTRSSAGTGIGLAIVRSLVEAHGGQISVTSELGQGTCFTICLPTVLSKPED